MARPKKVATAPEAADPNAPPQTPKHTRKRGRPKGWKKPEFAAPSTYNKPMAQTILQVGSDVLSKNQQKFSAALGVFPPDVNVLKRCLADVRITKADLVWLGDMFGGMEQRIETEIQEIEGRERAQPERAHRAAA
jgi:hypothetical protein